MFKFAVVFVMSDWSTPAPHETLLPRVALMAAGVVALYWVAEMKPI